MTNRAYRERLEGFVEGCLILDDTDPVALDVQSALTDLAEAQALLKEARESLRGIITVADRKTIEFDRAKATLAKLEETL